MRPVRLIHVMIVTFSLLFLRPAVTNAWDRYTNDAEYLLGSDYPFQAIIHYMFYISNRQTVTLQTANSTGDTYMYLWNETYHAQVARNDDSNGTLMSTIVATLDPGYYTIFVRSYSSNAASTCDLYMNGVQVLVGAKFAGTLVNMYINNAYLSPETRLRTDNLSSGGDTYILLLNTSGDLIGYNDDWGGLASMVEAAGQPAALIIGAYSPDREGTCSAKYTEDIRPEFLAVTDYETFHIQAANSFKNAFIAASDFYQYALQAKTWEFTGYDSDRMSYADGVDLIYVAAHGNIGGFADYDNKWVDFTKPDGSAGSGHRTNNLVGDLEYIAFGTCETVRIEDETSWDWLKTTGWQSYYDYNGVPQKGFFDGVHLAVGYHSLYWSYSVWWESYQSSYYEAADFAINLFLAQSVWDAWKNANRSATDQFEWWPWNSVDLGEISSIHIVPSVNESFYSYRTPDYKLGDSNYYFGWRKSHYWY